MMLKKSFFIGLGLTMLMLVLFAMIFIFRYEVDGYYENKNNYEASKQKLKNQLELLETQLIHPQTQANATARQAYHDKQRSLQRLEKQGLMSHVPEWPLLILGALGIIATRMLNYLIDIVCLSFHNYSKKLS
jgi:hypothetical protein